MPGAEQLRVDIRAKSFAGVPVLGTIAFTARAGECLAMLAPSGTGKTTALRIVLGLDKAFSGSVERPAGRIGAVFQEPCLLPWLSIGDNLRFVAPELSSVALHTLLAALDIAATERQFPGQISLGMARRVSLARALAVEPSLLVLDEPFASLDARLAARLALRVAENARTATVVMATHDLDQALVVANRVLVLAGRPAILVEDTPVPAEADRAEFAAGLRRRHPFLESAPA